MDLTGLSEATLNRLKRIQELRACSEQSALEFAIALGWLASEKDSKRNKIRSILPKRE